MRKLIVILSILLVLAPVFSPTHIVLSGTTPITNLTYFANLTATPISVPTSQYPYSPVGFSSSLQQVTQVNVTTPTAQYPQSILGFSVNSPSITQVSLTTGLQTISSGIYGFKPLIPSTTPLFNGLYKVLTNPPKPKAEAVEYAHSLGGNAYYNDMITLLALTILAVTVIFVLRRIH